MRRLNSFNTECESYARWLIVNRAVAPWLKASGDFARWRGHNQRVAKAERFLRRRQRARRSGRRFNTCARDVIAVFNGARYAADVATYRGSTALFNRLAGTARYLVVKPVI